MPSIKSELLLAQALPRRCVVCDRSPTHHLAVTCPRCTRLRSRSGSGKGRRTAALQASYNREIDAFRCYYSHAPLDENPASPWYISFDHRTPRDDSTVVVSSNMINHMKADLTESEFRLTVVQLAEVFTGTRERVDTFQPSHWRRT